MNKQDCCINIKRSNILHERNGQMLHSLPLTCHPTFFSSWVSRPQIRRLDKKNVLENSGVVIYFLYRDTSDRL